MSDDKRKRGRPPVWTQAEHDQMWRLWQDGHTAAHIAGIVGKSRSAVLGRIHRTRPANG